MAEELAFSEICSSGTPALDIVFIHGLTGDPEETWTSEGAREFWPKWLCVDFPNIAVYSLGYPASIFEKWAKNEMDIFERAASALDYLSAKGIGDRPVAFITHSLGGILAKAIIRKSCESDDGDWKKVCVATRLVAFLATPHTGASLASVLKCVFPHFASKHIDLLSNGMGILEDINQHYRSYANNRDELKTAAYYEKYKTKNSVLVVSRESADPGVKGTHPVATDKDHLNICKPCDRNDPIYAGLQRHIKQALTGTQDSALSEERAFQEDDYSARSDRDRRDLLEKLIAADREHEYAAANNYQNQFAQNYLKLGLYTSAREDSDKLLSEVEQRFITHIYHPLICKGESDDKIRVALQTEIIDPICAKRTGHNGFSEKTVLRALYFLTEQCHIRWDAEK